MSNIYNKLKEIYFDNIESVLNQINILKQFKIAFLYYFDEIKDLNENIKYILDLWNISFDEKLNIEKLIEIFKEELINKIENNDDNDKKIKYELIAITIYGIDYKNSNKYSDKINYIIQILLFIDNNQQFNNLIIQLIYGINNEYLLNKFIINFLLSKLLSLDYNLFLYSSFKLINNINDIILENSLKKLYENFPYSLKNNQNEIINFLQERLQDSQTKILKNNINFLHNNYNILLAKLEEERIKHEKYKEEQLKINKELLIKIENLENFVGCIQYRDIFKLIYKFFTQYYKENKNKSKKENNEDFINKLKRMFNNDYSIFEQNTNFFKFLEETVNIISYQNSLNIGMYINNYKLINLNEEDEIIINKIIDYIAKNKIYKFTFNDISRKNLCKLFKSFKLINFIKYPFNYEKQNINDLKKILDFFN